jgi:hypothetical protein
VKLNKPSRDKYDDMSIGTLLYRRQVKRGGRTKETCEFARSNVVNVRAKLMTTTSLVLSGSGKSVSKNERRNDP